MKQKCLSAVTITNSDAAGCTVMSDDGRAHRRNQRAWQHRQTCRGHQVW